MQLLAATLNLPLTIRNIRQASGELHKWKTILSGKGSLAFLGGVYESLNPEGLSTFHAHILVSSNIPASTLILTWRAQTRLQTGAVIIPVWNMGQWLQYIKDNEGKNIRFRPVRYRDNIITKTNLFTEGVSKKWLS